MSNGIKGGIYGFKTKNKKTPKWFRNSNGMWRNYHCDVMLKCNSDSAFPLRLVCKPSSALLGSCNRYLVVTMRQLCLKKCNASRCKGFVRCCIKVSWRTTELHTAHLMKIAFIQHFYYNLYRLSSNKIMVLYCRVLKRVFQRHIDMNKHRLDEVNPPLFFL